MSVCVNSKLTAAVKFLSEHHRGEADGSWQGAGAQGGGIGRWRWATSEGRRCSGARLMIEGSVGLCRISVREYWCFYCYYPDLAECNMLSCYLGVWSEMSVSSKSFSSKCVYRWCSLTFSLGWNRSQLSPLHLKCGGNSTGSTMWEGWSGECAMWSNKHHNYCIY